MTDEEYADKLALVGKLRQRFAPRNEHAAARIRGFTEGLTGEENPSGVLDNPQYTEDARAGFSAGNWTSIGSDVPGLGSASKAMIVSAARLGKNLDVVKALRKGGLSEASVFQNTGVYQDAGGKKAKAAIPDDAAVVTDRLANSPSFDEMLLSQALAHPSLYELYPELAKTTVSRSPGFGAAFVPRYNHIRVGDDLEGEALRSSMLHEVQHVVQKADKTQGGGDAAFIAGDLGIPYEQAQKIYAKLPGEQEARFTEATKHMSKRQLDEELVKLLRTGMTPAKQY